MQECWLPAAIRTRSVLFGNEKVTVGNICTNFLSSPKGLQSVSQHAAWNLYVPPGGPDKTLTTAGPAMGRSWSMTMLIGKVGLKRQQTPQVDRGAA